MDKSSKNNIVQFPAKIKKTKPSKGFSLFNEGMYFFYKDDDEMALKKFLQAEQEGYISAEMFANLSWLFNSKNEPEKALSYVKKSLEVDGEYGYAHYFLGDLLTDKNQTAEALEHYLLAEKLGYSQPLLFLHISQTYNAMTPSNYLKAMEYSTKLVQKYPEHPEAYKWKGLLLYNKQQFDKALIYFKKAEKINPPSEDLYFFISYCYDLIGKLNQAIEYANKIIFLLKDDSRGYYRKAFTYFRYFDLEHAKENFLLADKYNCPYADMYSRLAYIYIFGENPDRELAMKYVNKALEIDKFDNESYYVLGSIFLVFDRDYKTALKYYRKFYKKEKYPSLEFYSNFCFALMATHQFKRADKYLDEGLRLYEDDQYLWSLKVTVNTALKNYKEVYKYTRKLYEADKTNPEVVYNMALYHFYKRNYKTCIKYCKKIPDSRFDKFIILASCYLSVGQKEKSISSMTHFLEQADVKDFLTENNKAFEGYYRQIKQDFPDSPLVALIEDKFQDVINPPQKH